jgi:hypothetical protein
MNDYEILMRELQKSHQTFKKEWNNRSKKNHNPETITLARNKFWDDLNRLWSLKLAPLQIKFAENPLDTVDEVIEFLSVDILAFRCGYVKEFFLAKLKSIELNTLQQEKLKQIALNLCKKPRFRREFGDWARLMIKIADQSFINQLNELAETDLSAKKICQWLRNKIVENRNDLKSSFD